ncbi:response regulator [Fibrella sp. HMF5335]|uniref:Response regulator n=1 Tax=Fibrella rubiginis TaxID=2817060 RepID=A0A939GEK4_9BACT|nr:response regulator [Fibrella rubiginis]MBO0936343.1 response regulator [Fibrella rubiginis]
MKSIWRVDDDHQEHTPFKAVVTQTGATLPISSFFNGSALLEALTTTAPLSDLIILYLHMPRMNGLETLQAMGRNPAFDDVPIVLNSASATPSLRAVAQQLGAECRIKPTTLLAMRDSMHYLLQRY